FVVMPYLLAFPTRRSSDLGKWHLGNGDQHHPGNRGFDEAIVSNGRHFDFKTDPPVDYPEGEYLADFLTKRAVDFIRNHKDEPFLDRKSTRLNSSHVKISYA